MMNKVFYIGGSPCSGKSTVAELLAQQYNLHYFKVDDYLEKYADMGAIRNEVICKKLKEMSTDEIWMREPVLQCAEEFQFYSEIFDDIIEDIMKIRCESDIITEGAAFCPELIKRQGISAKYFFALIPEPDFQITHYSQREWVTYVLDGCNDKEKAFSNWMQRDILFARQIENECKRNEFNYFINDGQKSVKELTDIVSKHFELEC